MGLKHLGAKQLHKPPKVATDPKTFAGVCERGLRGLPEPFFPPRFSLPRNTHHHRTSCTHAREQAPLNVCPAADVHSRPDISSEKPWESVLTSVHMEGVERVSFLRPQAGFLSMGRFAARLPSSRLPFQGRFCRQAPMTLGRARGASLFPYTRLHVPRT